MVSLYRDLQVFVFASDQPCHEGKDVNVFIAWAGVVFVCWLENLVFGQRARVFVDLADRLFFSNQSADQDTPPPAQGDLEMVSGNK